jgi:hypothetical protein
MSVRGALTPLLSADDIAIPDRAADGSVTLSKVVGPLGIELRKHSTAENIRSAVGEETWNRYFKFSFVRHPIDRLVSLFEFLERVRQTHEPALGGGKKRFLSRRSNLLAGYPDQAPWNWLAMRALLTTDSFSEFIRSKYLDQAQDAKPQMHSLTDTTGQLIVDFVGKVEHLADDWGKVCERIGGQASLLRENESQRRFSEIGDYLQGNDLDFLAQKYRCDFESFSYLPDEFF